MANLSLGNFTFGDFAIPEFIRMLGPEHVNVHRQPGGARQIDILGRDDEPYQWRGQFLGANATSNATTLDSMRVTSGIYALVFGVWTQDVVITKLVYHYRRDNWIEYEIECTPVFNAGDNPAEQPAPQQDVNNAGNAGAGP
jgi:hypothetical protein